MFGQWIYYKNTKKSSAWFISITTKIAKQRQQKHSKQQSWHLKINSVYDFKILIETSNGVQLNY